MRQGVKVEHNQPSAVRLLRITPVTSSVDGPVPLVAQAAHRLSLYWHSVDLRNVADAAGTHKNRRDPFRVLE